MSKVTPTREMKAKVALMRNEDEIDLDLYDQNMNKMLSKVDVAPLQCIVPELDGYWLDISG